MAESMRADSSRYALRPADSSVIDVACLRLVNLLQGHAPQTTRANEASNWKHWLAFCAHMNTSPWRDDAAANAGGEGHEREINVLALGLLYIYARMQPAKRSPNTPPKPASGSCAAAPWTRKASAARRSVHRRRMMAAGADLCASFARTRAASSVLQAQRVWRLCCTD